MLNETQKPTILLLAHVIAIVKMSRASIYRKVKEGTFPKPFKLNGSNINVWLESEIYDWLNNCIAEARGAKHAA